MRRFLIFLSVVFMTVSCLDTGTVSQKYQLVTLFDNAYKFGADSTYQYSQGVGFNYDLLGFFHEIDSVSKNFDGGFLVSCLDTPKSGSTEGLRNTYRAYLAKEAVFNGNAYAVYYSNPDQTLMPEHDIKFLAAEDGTCTMQGCFVANTVEVADWVKANFKKDDKLTLKVTGYLAGTKTGSAEIALADYTMKDSIVSKWTPLDLAKLGSVDFIDLDLISTNKDVPGYVCLDSVIATIDISY